MKNLLEYHVVIAMPYHMEYEAPCIHQVFKTELMALRFALGMCTDVMYVNPPCQDSNVLIYAIPRKDKTEFDELSFTPVRFIPQN